MTVLGTSALGADLSPAQPRESSRPAPSALEAYQEAAAAQAPPLSPPEPAAAQAPPLNPPEPPGAPTQTPPASPTEAPAPPASEALGWRARLRGGWHSTWTLLYGVIGLLAGLSALAAIPVLQFATLGWMLEVEARLTRGEGWRSALPGLRKAVPFGSGLLGCGALLLPWLIFWHLYRDARLIAPGSTAVQVTGSLALGYGVLAASHAALSLAAGRGALSAFFTPFKNLQVLYRERGTRQPLPSRVARGLRELRLDHYVAQGVRGFLAAAIWLTPPSLLLAGAKNAPVLGLIGGLWLVLVLRTAMVAQGRAIAEGRLSAALEWGALRAAVRRAPFTTALALLLTLALALPLYLLKIVLLPRDALWLPAIAFVLLLFPTRLARGWAMRRALQPGAAPWYFRWLGRAIALPAAGIYVFMAFFNQFFAWRGSTALLAHHAFFVPVAFY